MNAGEFYVDAGKAYIYTRGVNIQATEENRKAIQEFLTGQGITAVLENGYLVVDAAHKEALLKGEGAAEVAKPEVQRVQEEQPAAVGAGARQAKGVSVEW